MRTRSLPVHTLSSGLRAVIEPIEGARSVSAHLRFDFGGKDDPPGRAGLAALTEATVLRGSPGMSLRKLLNALDDYGVDRESSTSVEHTDFAFTCLPQCLGPVLKLYGRLLANPSFPAQQLETAREIAEQAVLDMEDNPAQTATWRAYRAALGGRLGRHPSGRIETLRTTTRGDVESFWRRFRSAAMLQVTLAGAVEEQEAMRMLEAAFGQWETSASASPARPRFQPRNAEKHYDGKHGQTYIRLAYPTAPPGHPLYGAGVLVKTVLAGGSANRLFTEIREKRGLAYHVGGFCRAWRGGALMIIGAETTRARSGETLKVCKGELARLTTITEPELERAKSIVKGYLLTSGELVESRAFSLAVDLFLTGRPRRLSEIVDAIDSVTLDETRELVRAFPPSPLTVVTLG
jgi:predicted Zn-dependent peptidase